MPQLLLFQMGDIGKVLQHLSQVCFPQVHFPEMVTVTSHEGRPKGFGPCAPVACLPTPHSCLPLSLWLHSAGDTQGPWELHCGHPGDMTSLGFHVDGLCLQSL